jgi:hypothetical protein
MLISVHKRFVFVANTKAASTSIEAVLARHAEISRPGGPQEKHTPLAQVRWDYRFLFTMPDYPFESFFRFGVMREPLDWIESWFRYRKGNKVASPLPASMTFAEFWEQGDWNIRRRDGTPYQQSDMFVDKRGAVLTDLIVPYHRLNEALPIVLQALGIKADVPHLNVSTLKSVDRSLSPELRARLRAHYAADYALFDSLDARLDPALAALRNARVAAS